VRRSNRGFTLLEVLIALAILAGAVTTLVVTFNHHLSLVLRNRETTAALLLGRAKLEDPGFITSQASEGTFAPEFPAMSWKREQTESSFPGMKRYLLTISWQSGREALTLVSYDRK